MSSNVLTIVAQAGSRTPVTSARPAPATALSASSQPPHAHCASRTACRPTLIRCLCAASTNALAELSWTRQQRNAHPASLPATPAPALSSAHPATAQILTTPTSFSTQGRTDASRTAQRHLFLHQTRTAMRARRLAKLVRRTLSSAQAAWRVHSCTRTISVSRAAPSSTSRTMRHESAHTSASLPFLCPSLSSLSLSPSVSVSATLSRVLTVKVANRRAQLSSSPCSPSWTFFCESIGPS